jgi:hypothetical protein
VKYLIFHRIIFENFNFKFELHGSESCNIHFLENADDVDGGINLTPTPLPGTY